MSEDGKERKGFLGGKDRERERERERERPGKRGIRHQEALRNRSLGTLKSWASGEGVESGQVTQLCLGLAWPALSEFGKDE
jgi:hypothetical protein